MGVSQKSLARGEHKVLTLRTHLKALWGPIALLILIVAAAGTGAYFVPASEYQTGARLAIALAGVLLAVWVFVVPFLRWITTTYTLTNRRLMTRTGVINRSGRDIPLYRINDVSFDQDLLDRMLRCGTLIVHDASEQEGVRMNDIPNIEQVQVLLQELLHAADDGTDEGDRVPGDRRR